MSHCLILNIDNNIDQDYNLKIDEDGFIILTVSPTAKFDQIINHEQFKNELLELQEICDYSKDSLYSDNFDWLNELASGKAELFDTTDYILIKSDAETARYINSNPNLKTKKFLLNSFFSVTSESLKEIDDAFFNLDNVYVQVDGNDSFVSLDEYKQTVEIINEYMNKIKKYNLSPLEQLVYAYDLVRDRMYVKEGIDDSYTDSRDLTRVLLGDKIVCVGYAQMFDKIIKALGFKSEVSVIKRPGSHSAHMRNVVHLVDNKYGIEGIYFFDPTADRKKKSSSSNYLNSYMYFAKMRDDMQYPDSDYIDDFFNNIDDEFLLDAQDTIESGGVAALSYVDKTIINSISKFIDGIYLFPDFNHSCFENDDTSLILKHLDRYQSLLFYNIIPCKKMLEAIYNVRKIEYIEDPVKYPFSRESFKSIVKGSDFIDFDDVLFQCASNDNSDYDGFCDRYIDKIIDEFETGKKVEQVRLVSTLQRIRDVKSKKI